MEKLLDPIMKKLLDRGFVDDENAEIVRYGLELLIMKTIISAMMIATALITQSVPEVMVFVLSYALLRGCCGGYHAGSRIVCFILSMFLLSAVISAVKLIGGTAALFTSIGFICMALVQRICLQRQNDSCVKQQTSDCAFSPTSIQVLIYKHFEL